LYTQRWHKMLVFVPLVAEMKSSTTVAESA
jgi:hypothetical protein